MLLQKQTAFAQAVAPHQLTPALRPLITRFGTSTRASRDDVSTTSADYVQTTPSLRRPIVLAGAVETITRPAVSTSAPASPASTSAPSTSSPAKGSSKWVIDDNEQLASTTEHRLWTFGSMALMAGILYQAVGQAQNVGDAAVVALGVAAAYVLSDLGTGIYHWSVDNYGDGNTPLVGRQIAAFQGHHQRPWTITQREFCNNVHQVFKPAAYPAGLFCLLAHWMPLGWNAFIGPFIFLVCMSQQFHAWSHMKKSELPDIVLSLQDAGLLISRKAHGAHHRAPFEGNYCIVSGLWNEPLDNSGFFRGFEKVVHAVTGVEPRCWHEPDYSWEPMEESSAADA